MHEQVTAAEVAYITKRLRSEKDDAIDVARAAGLSVWEGRGTVRKYHGESTASSDLYEVVESPPNLLLTAGVTAAWNLITGAGGTAFGSTSFIGVGDSSAVAAAAQTDLQAATNKVRFAVSSSPTVATNQCTWSGTAGTTIGNFQWNEAGIFTLTSGGVMLNRLVTTFGTKTSAASWVLSLTISLA